MKILRKYKLLVFYIYLTLWTSLASTPLNEVFEFPTVVNQVFSLLLYLPFFLILLWKLFSDIKSFQKTAVNIIFYLLSLYYVILTVYRFFNGMQVKENIYYSVVFLGSIALFTQLKYNRIRFEEKDYSANFYGIIAYTVIYKWIFTILATNMLGIGRILGNPPINNLYSTSIIVMLIPFMIDGLRKSSSKKINWHMILLTLALILVIICNSRAIVVLSALIIAVLVFINIRNGKMFLKSVISIFCTGLIVFIMAALNVPTIGYSLYRATGISISGLTQSYDDYINEEGGFSTHEDAINQVNRSDTMRSDLMKLGIEEFKKNYLFGTGELFYSYDMGYKVMEQTAHNFIIESLVCYGLIGTMMIAALIIAILVECGFFKRKCGVSWQVKISAFAVLGYYFVFGMVQPSVYNAMLCPMFYVIMAYFGHIFSFKADESMHEQIEN